MFGRYIIINRKLWTEVFLIVFKKSYCELKEGKEESHKNLRIFKLLRRFEL